MRQAREKFSLVFSIFYVSSRKRHRNRSPGHEELAFGPCGRLSLLSRTEPCEWPCTLKIGNLLCQVASGATLQKDANPYCNGHVYLAARYGWREFNVETLGKQGSWSGWTNRA